MLNLWQYFVSLNLSQWAYTGGLQVNNKSNIVKAKRFLIFQIVLADFDAF